MTPSHKAKAAEKQHRDGHALCWRLGVRLGGRFFKKLCLVAACIALILFISNLDPGGVYEVTEAILPIPDQELRSFTSEIVTIDEAV